MHVLHMTDLDLKEKRVLMREDFNVPMKDGHIAGDKRLREALPGIKLALENRAAVMLLSHLGRPKDGVFEAQFSLAPVAAWLSKELGRPVPLVSSYVDGVDVKPGDCVLFENVRFLAGETKDDEALGKKLAALCDIFVMDAFGSAHRAHSSTSAVARFAPQACAGPLLSAELAALEKALQKPARPMLAIIGGAKVSTKLTILDQLCKKVDQLIPGGGIANTFLLAAGYAIGASLAEPELVPEAKRLMESAKAAGNAIPLPVDVVVGKEFSEKAIARICDLSGIQPDDMILDIGPKTIKLYSEMIMEAGTIVWNGPVGAFELPQFSAGTREVGQAIADSPAYSLVGGGDTVTAVEDYNLQSKMSYLSTGGGAFLEFLEGRTLPAVAALEERAK
jgi:phosphoglycerate kinase